MGVVAQQVTEHVALYPINRLFGLVGVYLGRYVLPLLEHSGFEAS